MTSRRSPAHRARPEAPFDKLAVVGPCRDAEPADIERAEARFAEEVMPAVRRASA